MEEPDDRLEGESKAARDRRVFQDQMREARNERKDYGGGGSDASLAANNANIEAQKKDLAKKRMSFLMKQADVFGKFIGADAMKRCDPASLRTPLRRALKGCSHRDGFVAVFHLPALSPTCLP